MLSILKNYNYPINNFTIYGERHCGTNLLEKLVSKSFNIPMTSDYGHKHFFGFQTNETLNNAHNTLFICVARNPYEWIMAMRKIPYHIPERNRRNIKSLLLNPWKSINPYDSLEMIEDRNFITLEGYANIFDMRKTKLNYLFYAMPQLVDNYICMTYEYLLDNAENIMNIISNRFKLYYNKSNVLTNNKRPYTMSQNVFQMINNNIDWSAELSFGYKQLAFPRTSYVS